MRGLSHAVRSSIEEERKSTMDVRALTVRFLDWFNGLTPEDALVTTLSLSDGQARRRLREGLYRLRVIHPR
jgi:hypothetical protein